MKIGIFSTFIEPAALDLVKTVQDAVKTGEIPNSEIAFVFSNREQGESPVTDRILQQLTNQDFSLPTLSARRFAPEMRGQAKEAEARGNASLMQEWRNQFGTQMLNLLPETDLDLLLGDMYVWGENMCRERNGINLHPALPNGPKGEWYNVIWDLIQNRASETGVMMHKVIPELDRGPAVAYCRFPIQGYQFENLWDKLPKDPKELVQVIQQGRQEREKTQHPLHRKIREHGLAREFPLIIQTTRAFAEGAIRIEKQSLVDGNGRLLKGGYDLSKQINGIVKSQLEGSLSAQREVRR